MHVLDSDAYLWVCLRSCFVLYRFKFPVNFGIPVPFLADSWSSATFSFCSSVLVSDQEEEVRISLCLGLSHRRLTEAQTGSEQVVVCDRQSIAGYIIHGV